jgi:type IV pilus assembly protein PilY1
MAAVLALAALPAAAAERLDMADYCATPPFLNVKGERPNIMLFVDNSASMVYAAHSAARDFDPFFDFYGYFDSKACYTYDAGLERFSRSAIPPAIGGWCPQWSGNYLNWAFISRFEAIKKAMVGGRYDPATQLLIGENVSEVGNPKNKSNYCIPTASVNNPKTYNGALAAVAFGTSFQLERRSQVATIASKCSGGGIVKTNVRFVIDMAGEPEPTGVVHTLGAYSARWGFASFKPGAFKDAARVFVPYGYDPVTEPNPALNMVNVIRTLESEPTSGSSGEDDSPLAEAYFEILKYHAQATPSQVGNYQVNDIWDPWKEWERPGWPATDPIPQVPCRQSNVVFLSDGRPSNDGDGIADWDGVLDLREAGGINQAVRQWPPTTRPLYNPNPENDANIVDGLRLDDAAHCGRVGGDPCGLGGGGDLRPDIEATQRVDGYFIYAFGNNYGPRNVSQERGLPYMMYWAGAAGIFTDIGKPGNGRVDGIVERNNAGAIINVIEPTNPKEWDEDGDGEPDGFFDAANGEEIERAVRKAIERIIKRTSAGTSVAVLSQSGEGEASLFQAYFHPEFFDGTTSATWVGFLRGLWLDKFGNIRQDSSGPGTSTAELKPDQHLVLTDDKIIKYRFDSKQNETFVDLYSDPKGKGVTSPADYAGTVKISQLTSLFEAGQILHRRAPWTRRMYMALGPTSNVRGWFPWDVPVWQDTDSDGISDIMDLPLVDNQAHRALDYVMGVPVNKRHWLFLGEPHLASWRPRELYPDPNCTDMTCGTSTWKLGDIVYSTPVAVGAPSTRYDQIYGGKADGYAEFFTTHASRPQVVYVGANDGQLRAFYVGTFRNGASPTRTDADAWFDPMCDAKYNWQCSIGIPTGTEMWSWVPYNTLPTLKFLTRGDYCHTYYVDG